MKVRHMMYSPFLLQTEILHSFVKGYALNSIYGIKLSNSESQCDMCLTMVLTKCFLRDVQFTVQNVTYVKYEPKKKMTKQQIHSRECGPF